MNKLNMIDGAKSYATRANAVKKLADVLGDNPQGVTIMIAVNSAGRFVPVAIGQKALDLGLFHHGIYTCN